MSETEQVVETKSAVIEPPKRSGTPELNKALALAQAEFPVVSTDEESEYTTAKGQKIHFKWASLGSLRKAVVPILGKNGLCVRQDIKTDKGSVSIKTIIGHESGEEIASHPITFGCDLSDPKNVAGQVTYGCRYSFQAFLCIPIESAEDLDQESDPSDEEKWAKDAAEELPRLKQEMLALKQLIKNPPPRDKDCKIDLNDRTTLFRLLKKTTWDIDTLKGKILSIYEKDSTEELTVGQYNELCDLILALPIGKKTKVSDLPIHGEPVLDSTEADYQEPEVIPEPIDPNSLSGRLRDIASPEEFSEELTGPMDPYDKPF